MEMDKMNKLDKMDKMHKYKLQLKIFGRQLFLVLMSVTLIGHELAHILSLNPSIAYAQTNTNTGDANQQSDTTELSLRRSNTSEDIEKTKGGVSRSEIDWSALEMSAYTILLFFSSFMGMVVFKNCWRSIKNLSMIFYTLATLLHIGTEIAAYVKYKGVDAQNRITTDLRLVNKKEYIDSQIKTFEEAKKHIDNYADWINTKQIITSVVAGVYGVAAITAVIEAYFKPEKSWMQFECIKGEIENRKKQKERMEEVKENKKKMKPVFEELMKKYPKVVAAPVIPNLSSPEIENILAQFQDQIQDLKLNKWMTSLISLLFHSEALAQTPSPTPTGTPFDSGEVKFTGSMNIADAPDQFFKLLGWSGFVLGFIMMFIDRFSQPFLNLMSLAWMRAITFFAMGSLAGVVAGMFAIRKEKMKERSEYFAARIESLKAQDTTTFKNSITYMDMFSAPPSVSSGRSSSLQKRKTPCINVEPNKLQTDPQCACQNTPQGCGSALPTQSTAKELPFTYPSSIMSQFDAVANSSQQLANGNLTQASATAGQVLSFAASNLKIKNDIQKRLNENLQKDDLPPVNFDQDSKELLGHLSNEVVDQMKKSGFPPTDIAKAMDSIGVGLSTQDPENPALANAKAKNKGKSKSSLKGRGGAGGGKAAASDDEKDKKNGLENFDFSLDEGKPAAEAVAPIEANAEKASDFVDNLQDISPKQGEDIFKIVSRRYTLTAYPLFLIEVEDSNQDQK